MPTATTTTTTTLEPISALALSGSIVDAHSEAGSLGYALLDGLPAGAPKNACGHYRRGSQRAILCREIGRHVLVTYRSA